MTAVANSSFTAAQFNTHVRDNLNETSPAKASTAGQHFISTGPNSIAAVSFGLAFAANVSEQIFTTSFDEGDPIVGVTWVAPPSGRNLLVVSGVVETSTNLATTTLSFQILTGDVIGAGSSVLGPGLTRGIIAGQTVTTDAEALSGGSYVHPIFAQTPGQSYNARVMGQTTINEGGGCSSRSILVIPLL